MLRLTEKHSFNEAAGIPRGRRLRGQRTCGGREASMRPRVFPAEDLYEGIAQFFRVVLQ